MTPLPDRIRPDEKTLVFLALLGFLIFAAVGTASHEMWRDEHHAWLLARDAATPVQVIKNLEWDMTPPFWHLVLWVVTRFTHDPRAMQVVNLLFATGAAFVVLRFAPFRFVVRLLVVFSYFFAYEYAAISRVYALGTLLIVATCALWPQRDERPIAIGVLLVLLANTPSLYGCVAAGFFLVLYLFDLVERTEARKKLMLGAAITAGGIVISLAQTIPSSNNPFAVGKMTSAFELDRLVNIARFAVSVLIPIPDASQYEYWNTNFIAGRGVALDLVLGVVCLSIPVFFLRRHLRQLVAWAAVTAAILFAGYQGFFLSVRHGGFMFVMFVAALWIGRKERPDEEPTKAREAALVAFLVLSVIGSVIALVKETVTEFTAVERTAEFIREEGLDRMPIAGANDFVVASLVSLLDLEQIYYPQRGEWGTFVQWSPDRRLNTTLADLGDDVAEKVESTGQPMVVVLSEPPIREGPFGAELIRSARLSDRVGIRLVAAFTESVVSDEKQFVYIAEPITE